LHQKTFPTRSSRNFIAKGTTSMTTRSQFKFVCATATLGCLILLAPGAAANAADVTLLSSAAIRPVIEVLGPQFERASGHRLVSRFELTPAVKKLIDAGIPFDVAIANPPHIEDAIKQSGSEFGPERSNRMSARPMRSRALCLMQSRSRMLARARAACSFAASWNALASPTP
jgi:hypothetical protein